MWCFCFFEVVDEDDVVNAGDVAIAILIPIADGADCFPADDV